VHIVSLSPLRIIYALQSGLIVRAGSWELLGYDFVIDERLRVWLLEVNASPR